VGRFLYRLGKVCACWATSTTWRGIRLANLASTVCLLIASFRVSVRFLYGGFGTWANDDNQLLRPV